MGIVFVHNFGWLIGNTFKGRIGTMEELCEHSTLKNLVIMIHQWGGVDHNAEEMLQLDLSNPSGFVQEVKQRGARIYRCTSASEPDLGALRIILRGGRFVSEVRREPINNGSKSEQTAVWPVGGRHNSDIRELGGSTQGAVMDKEVKGLRRELEEQKRRAEQEADVFKEHIATMRSREESTRKEMVREHYQELEEQKRRAQEEADAFKKQAAEKESIRQEVSRELEDQKRKAQEEADELRKYIVELQSKLEEDRHASGKASANIVFDLLLPIREYSSWDHSPSLTAGLPLDRSSPQFANRLNDALHGQEYEQWVQKIQEDDLVWFVDYLDKARHRVTLPHLTLKLASRLSTVLILRDPLPASACVNSEVYVRPIQHSQHPAQFLPTFLPLIQIHSPPVPSVRCIARHSMAHPFVSNVCEWLLRMLSHFPPKCVSAQPHSIFIFTHESKVVL